MENTWVKVAKSAKDFSISDEEYNLLKKAAELLSATEGEENERY